MNYSLLNKAEKNRAEIPWQLQWGDKTDRFIEDFLFHQPRVGPFPVKKKLHKSRGMSEKLISKLLLNFSKEKVGQQSRVIFL